MDRRNFMSLAAVGGGVVFASALPGCAAMADSYGSAEKKDFFFVQLSDIHWGYEGPANPLAHETLKRTVATVNAMPVTPDFIMFTGDLTHTTDDPLERRRRLAEFKTLIAPLKVKTVRFIPGEHDAALDAGAAYKEFFGETYYSFDHKGVHFIALDNVSEAGSKLGEQQLAWLKDHLANRDLAAPMVVLTHRPLFDLAPTWDWATRDGAQAMAMLMPFQNVSVFYGHIHQEHHHMTGHIAHHSAKSLVFPLPVAKSEEKRTPLPWNTAEPFKGLGWREIDMASTGAVAKIQEFAVEPKA